MELLKQRNRPPGVRRETAPDSRAQTQTLTGRRLGRRVWLGSLVLLLAPVFLAALVRGDVFNEYDVKATCLYHLTQFVEWPPEAFPETQSPLVIGVLGQDPFGKVLDEVFRNEIVKNRKL